MVVKPDCLWNRCARDKFVVCTDQAANRQTGCRRTELAILDRHHFAMEDIHSIEIPKVAECARCGVCAIAELVHTACIPHLRPVGEALSDAQGLNFADDRGSIDEMNSNGRMREKLALLRINDVGGGRQEPASLAFEG